MTTLSSQTLVATETAILASARFTQLSQSFVATAGSSTLIINPFRRPGLPSADPGWLCESTVGATVRAVFHENPQARTIYLVIDRDNAPLTGNYVVQINALTAVTYNATSSAPADVDALIDGIVAAIAGDAPTAAVVTASAYAMESGGDLDAIKLQAVVADATTYNTFILAPSTAFPGAADLVVVREVESASLRIWTRANHTTAQSVVSSAPLTAMTLAWTIARDVSLEGTEPLQNGGWMEQLNVATAAAVWIELYSATVAADTYSGTYVNLAAAYIAPALTAAA